MTDPSISSMLEVAADLGPSQTSCNRAKFRRFAILNVLNYMMDTAWGVLVGAHKPRDNLSYHLTSVQVREDKKAGEDAAIVLNPPAPNNQHLVRHIKTIS
ncbi:hypothetical protein EUGRSUZ_K01199 [Eucalyptus grandis]|uniref:Uncharacterized protein n=2 Tax=Eucalyptus grandis TaxID=71139 RepID=A0ACC3ISH8_EUCGR|nr:hypothetical protein EUGRSUZ_K01199 [Eucalyptus grandis]